MEDEEGGRRRKEEEEKKGKSRTRKTKGHEVEAVKRWEKKQWGKYNHNTLWICMTI